MSEDVYRALKRDVLTLVHRPGEPLRELELAERYGSSRVPVREALGRLHQEGLADSVPYKGFFASPISVKDISDTFELRVLLEVHSVRLAARRADDESLEALARLGHVEYTYDDFQSYTEFLSPPREAGTKMLKLQDELWTYTPATDRVIRISGHMLRQSVMGSDLRMRI